MVTDRPHIEYAPPLPLYRRRKTRASAVAIFSAAIIFALAWSFGPGAWSRTKLLYWQSRCMRYSPPAQQVIYDDDQDLLRRCVKGDPALADYSETTGTFHGGILRMAEPWYWFYDLYSPPGRAEAPTIFLHERRSSRGSRLVVVELEGTDYSLAPGPFPAGSPLVITLTVSVLEPAALIRSPTQVSERVVRLDVARHQGQTHFRCMAGQCDASDHSHFTANFQLDGKPGVLDGWLRDDDTVRLQVRAAIPAP